MPGARGVAIKPALEPNGGYLQGLKVSKEVCLRYCFLAENHGAPLLEAMLRNWFCQRRVAFLGAQFSKWEKSVSQEGQGVTPGGSESIAEWDPACVLLEQIGAGLRMFGGFQN